MLHNTHKWLSNTVISFMWGPKADETHMWVGLTGKGAWVNNRDLNYIRFMHLSVFGECIIRVSFEHLSFQLNFT